MQLGMQGSARRNSNMTLDLATHALTLTFLLKGWHRALFVRLKANKGSFGTLLWGHRVSCCWLEVLRSPSAKAGPFSIRLMSLRGFAVQICVCSPQTRQAEYR